MLGTKFYKGNFTDEEYAQAAAWCNETQTATIEDKGDYYEVVALPQESMEELIAEKIKQLKQIRDGKELEPVLYDGAYFDFDEKSYNRITAAIFTLEQAGQGATITWTTADNHSKTVSATDLRGVIAAAGFRSNALHIKYRELREQVDSALSKEDLDEIVWG